MNSRGEQEIARILEDWKVAYRQEVLLGDSRRRYDFGLLDVRLLIEFDGYQHFHPVAFSWQTDHFAEYQKRVVIDIEKNELAESQGYLLLRIHHEDLTNMEPVIAEAIEDATLGKTGVVFSRTEPYQQDGVLKKVANFCTQWRGVTRDNCLDCYWPDGNSIAIRTGEESGVLVLDIDNASSDEKLNGMQLHEMWTLRHGELNTWTAKTGKDGLHLYFKFPTEASYGVNNRTGLVVEDKLYGVDIRGQGGVIFSPPSSYLAPDGTELRYEWVKSPFDTPLAEVPEWLEEVLIENDRIGNFLWNPAI
ncbi:hypothetical protein KFL_005560135 [Klebsormidium nitens]|uniref:DNA primase/polymerase bifunctional N-terminal domain-containing protein n=1 Tax=Klebsormidium nitens TaxID=105231 RepID=A0A1Y1IFW8_KLENI|nr:hypothetical protein KFL_005560135 [Klebsormidium nitens]|eukprot:GAQ89735.1 hypothetical protein KFL_005560135 [Klebsormidium nitens]